MNKVIHRLKLTEGVFSASFAPNTSILKFGVDVQGDMSIWYAFNEGDDTKADDQVYRSFQVVGTGHTYLDNLIYIDTCVHSPFVWHLFEVPQARKRLLEKGVWPRCPECGSPDPDELHSGACSYGKPVNDEGGEMEGSAFGDHMRESL